ncbi:MAG: hypothetical protein H3C31_12615 [Brumimicrobium sp.]|nr:hypothetical protein [Brumimicrobium sp.]
MENKDKTMIEKKEVKKQNTPKKKTNLASEIRKLSKEINRKATERMFKDLIMGK